MCFDKHLKFDHHIKHVNTKLSKSIGILYKIYKYLPINTLKLLYHTFIQPYISYGIESGVNANKTYTNNIFMLQKKAIRLISKIGYREHTNNYFKAMNILKLEELFQIQTCS